MPRLSQAVHHPQSSRDHHQETNYYLAGKHVDKQERVLGKPESTESNWRKPVLVKAEVQVRMCT